jgi:hypothetical protein
MACDPHAAAGFRHAKLTTLDRRLAAHRVDRARDRVGHGAHRDRWRCECTRARSGDPLHGSHFVRVVRRRVQCERPTRACAASVYALAAAQPSSARRRIRCLTLHPRCGDRPVRGAPTDRVPRAHAHHESDPRPDRVRVHRRDGRDVVRSERCLDRPARFQGPAHVRFDLHLGCILQRVPDSRVARCTELLAPGRALAGGDGLAAVGGGARTSARSSPRVG